MFPTYIVTLFTYYFKIISTKGNYLVASKKVIASIPDSGL